MQRKKKFGFQCMHLILAVSPVVTGALLYLWPSKVEVIDFSDVSPLSDTSLLAASAIGLWNAFQSSRSSNLLSDRNDDFFLMQRRRPELLNSLPGFTALQSVVLDRVALYLGLPSSALRVLAWTAVQTTAGDYHSPHTHTGEAAVAVFYASTSRNSGSLLFMDPRGHVPPFGRRRELRPTTGTLVIFPSWLPHSAMPCNDPNGDPRVVFAFNVALINQTAGSASWAHDLSADLQLEL